MTNDQEFLAACLGTQPVRLTVAGAGRGGPPLEVATPCVVVGSGPGADVDLTGLTAGPPPPRAVYFQLFDGHLFAAPLSPDVPVTLNGLPFTPGWVGPADVLSVAGVQVRAWNPARPAGGVPVTSPVRKRDGAPLYFLERLFAADGPGLVAGRRALWLAGRSPPAKLQIPVPELAPVHAALVATPTGVWAVNLAGPDGLTVDREPVAFARLRAGSAVGLAGREFLFHPTAPTGPPPARTPPPAAVAVPAPDMTAVLDHVARIQEQTFAQFQQVLGSVVQMVNTVMAEQREFVAGELDRMERLMRQAGTLPPAGPADAAAPLTVGPAQAAARAAPPLPALPASAPRTPDADAKLHTWVQQQLRGLEKDQGTVWQRFKDRLRGDG